MIILILFLLNFSEVSAEEQWWDQPRQEAMSHYLYSSCSTGSSVEEDETEEKAFQKGVRMMAQEFFPSMIDIRTSGNGDLDGINLTTKFMSKFCPMMFRGITRNKIKKMKDYPEDGSTRVCVQIKINKQEIENAEFKCRPEDLKNVEAVDDHFPLTVTTNKEGVKISLFHAQSNFNSAGMTPQTFNLPRGKFRYVISDPRFEDIHGEFIHKSETDKLFIRLTPKKTLVQFQLNPKDAKISINGKRLKDDEFYLDAGESYEIKVEHRDYNSLQKTMKVYGEKEKVEEISLKPLPSIYRFHFNVPQPHVTINGVIYDSEYGIFSIYPGERKFKIEAVGYETKEFTLDVEPNKNYPAEKINLRRVEDTFKFSDYILYHKAVSDFNWRFELNPFIHFEDKNYFSNFPVGLHFQNRLASLGLNFVYVGPLEEDEFADTPYLDRNANFRLFLNDEFYLSVSSGLLFQSKEHQNKRIEVETRYMSYGLGLRSNNQEGWSTQLELHYQKMDNPITNESEGKMKFIFGFGYNF